ncbi:MAG: aminoacyl-histidine dipeptidase [Treponema sp.]|nr:MAG: aminoacyl-histidine dipeptidase [Treponema sp.]
MSNKIDNLEPKEVFHWFHEISQVPRGSGNEKAISDFLVDFAKQRNLEVYQDHVLNVIIKKPGTTGYENSKPVIVQGHMDMVCEKTANSNHDFLKDPIELVVKGDELWANNTTLGADDGVAVAYALALLDANDIPHPPVEVVITTSEETGMDGALGLTNDHLDSSIVINIDSEEEGIFLVSCAGGANVSAEFDIKREALKNSVLEISVDGLTGGHSGIEIIKQRANAIKVLGRLLNSLNGNVDFNLVKISGGSKHNAIASSASAFVAVSDSAKSESLINDLAEKIKTEYRTTDKGLNVKTSMSSANFSEMFTTECTMSIVDFLIMVPDSTQRMSKDIEGLVETSLNNGVLEEKDGKLEFTISVRSSVKSVLDSLIENIKIMAKRAGGVAQHNSEYPAWEYVADSRVREVAIKTWKELTGNEPEIAAIHAGLECGIFNKIIPNMDAISFGPDMADVHTPREHVSIPSIKKMWEFFKAFLANLK